MQPEFWESRWKAGQIGFHMDTVHPDLVAHAPWFLGTSPKRVLVPLCGKSRDLAWMADRGHEVVGVELVRTAVEQLFAEAGLTPTWSTVPGGAKATAGRITVFQGDFFGFPADTFGPVDRVWDRAALVAIHPSQRVAYVDRYRALAHHDPIILLNVLQYDPTVMDGPPWSVSDEAVEALFDEVTLLDRADALDDRWRQRGHTWLRSACFKVRVRPTDTM